MSRWNTDHGIGVGDVLVTREGPWFASAAIRLGARIAGLPHHVNHTIIAHHVDVAGRWWGIEGRPGGVGWVDLSTRLRHPLTNVNNEQPKTEEQRYLIAVASEELLGVSYDWATIAKHVGVSVRELIKRTGQARAVTDGIWSRVAEWKENGPAPAHVVCSSFADWAYEKVGLPNPGGTNLTRMTTPGHWDQFIMRQGWQ